MRAAQVVATGSFVPARQVPNSELRERFARTHPDTIDKLEASTGITTRFHAPDDWATSDLAVAAANQALARAELHARAIDLVVVATDCPDYVTPATSVIVQHKLGALRAGAFDVGCACASFPAALAATAGIIATQRGVVNALVIGAYMMRKHCAADDPTIFFYGDGAGAVVLRASNEPGFLSAAFAADGSYAGRWGIFSGGTAEPATESAVKSGRTRVRLLEKYPDSVNEEGWPTLIERVARDSDFRVAEIDHLVLTQVRKKTIVRVMETLRLPVTRAPMIMDRVGYTGSACIPMVLDRLVTERRLRVGDRVVMVGSGIGFAQAAAAVRIGCELPC